MQRVGKHTKEQEVQRSHRTECDRWDDEDGGGTSKESSKERMAFSPSHPNIKTQHQKFLDSAGFQIFD